MVGRRIHGPSPGFAENIRHLVNVGAAEACEIFTPILTLRNLTVA